MGSETYTFGAENVYVLGAKRIRFGRETYTSCLRNVYVLAVKRIRFGCETYTSWTKELWVKEGSVRRCERLGEDLGYQALPSGRRFA